MSESIQAMRERRNALAKEARNLHENTPADGWNAEAQAKYDEKMDHIGRVDASMKRHAEVLALDAERQFNDVQASAKVENKLDERSVFNAWARQGLEGMQSEQRAAIRNVMDTTTGADGGYTVQTEVAKALQDALKLYGSVRAVADVFTTAQGNDIQYPNSDGTSELGELIGQNVTATAADPVFGTTTLSVYKFSSKVVAVPFELLQDSSIDIEAMIRKRLVDRLGRITNQFYTTGTGSSQPRGVVTASSAGKVGLVGQTLSVIYDDLVDLQHAVDPAYRIGNACSFMFNDLSLKVIRKVKDNNQRPIFVPGFEQGNPGGMPDTLLGSPIQINQDMAVMAANAKSILFGNFNYYKIRDAMGFTLFRFADSAYAKLGQVGFLAWMRSGANYVDVGASMKYYANSAT